MSKRICYWLIGFMIATIVITAIAANYAYLGVGYVDVTVVIVVSDAESGEPIGGAIVTCRMWNQTDNRAEEIELETDSKGNANIVVQDIMFTSDDRPLRSTRYRVYPIGIVATVVANGYRPSEPLKLSSSPYREATEIIGQRQARLIVPVALQPRMPEGK